MQPSSTGVREHVEHIALRLFFIDANFIDIMLLPVLLPLLFNLAKTVFHDFALNIKRMPKVRKEGGIRN